MDSSLSTNMSTSNTLSKINESVTNGEINAIDSGSKGII